MNKRDIARKAIIATLANLLEGKRADADRTSILDEKRENVKLMFSSLAAEIDKKK